MWVEVRADERAPAAASTPLRDVWAGGGIEIDAPPTEAKSSEPVPSEPARAPVPGAAMSTPKRAATRRPISLPPPAKALAAAPVASAAEPSSAAAATSGSISPAPLAAFGAAGLPPGVRHLPRAFARAVALANRTDAAWRTLPPGVVGEASVALPVKEDGALGSLAFDDTRERDRLLPAVRRMLDNTVLLLASGRFSLDSRELSAGVMRVRVKVEILEQSALANPDVDPNELNAIDYEPPQGGNPGHGAFLLNSGRRVVCWVTPLG